MITGLVSHDEAKIRLKVKGRQGRELEVEAVVDTGYTGALTLPPALIKKLDLRWQTIAHVTLADGSSCIFDVYEGNLDWDGNQRQIAIDEADAAPLVGMRLLRGHELNMHVRARGKVTIKRKPR